MSDTLPPNEPSRPGNTTARHRMIGQRLLTIRAAWTLITALSLLVLALAWPEEIHRVNDATRWEEVITREQLDIPPAVLSAYILALQTVSTVVFVGVALILFRGRSGDWLIALTSVMLLTFGGLVIDGKTALLGEAHPQLEPLLDSLDAIGQGSFVLFLYLFPSGRFAPAWTKPFGVGGMLAVIVMSFWPDAALESSPAALFIPLVIYSVVIYSGFSSRWRAQKYASPEQEQQAKWISSGLLFAFAGYVVWIFPQLGFPALAEPGIPRLLFFLAGQSFMLATLTLLPITVGFSMMRLRLWEVDFVINRSLVYIGLTALLLVGFIGCFLLLHIGLEPLVGQEQPILAVGLSAAVMAGFFHPTRNFLRRLIDKNVYGIELDYEKAAQERKALAKVIQEQADAATHFQDYTNLKLLGRGGMGEVYLSEHPTLRRPVAIKIMPGQQAIAEDARKRFIREAQITARLKHPNIVQVFDVGENNGAPYMVMEYINGPSLSKLLEERGRLSLIEAQPIWRDIAAALDYAHQQGIVHRDIKPSNVMIELAPANAGSPRRAVLMDFGIAKMYASVTRLTGTGMMVGTLSYIAPEQIQGEPNVGGAADIYSFGIMAYEMLTGVLPFQQANPGAVLLAHLMQPPPDPRDIVDDIPRVVARAILQALAKVPAERFLTAGEMIAAMGA